LVGKRVIYGMREVNRRTPGVKPSGKGKGGTKRSVGRDQKVKGSGIEQKPPKTKVGPVVKGES